MKRAETPTRSMTISADSSVPCERSARLLPARAVGPPAEAHDGIAGAARDTAEAVAPTPARVREVREPSDIRGATMGVLWPCCAVFREVTAAPMRGDGNSAAQS
jgi:hypothetical protein